MTSQLVILERDGVVNEDSPNQIRSPEEWVPLPGSLEAIARLHQAGIKVVIVTNQPGIKRRLFSVETLNAIHSKLHRMVAEMGGHIDAIIFCPHSAKDACRCRIPKPGMLLSVIERMHLAVGDVFFVGDKSTDVQAALAAGVHPVLVRTGHGLKDLQADMSLTAVATFDDLNSFVEDLLASGADRTAARSKSTSR